LRNRPLAARACYAPVVRNRGYTFIERAPEDARGLTVLDYYAARHPHFGREAWREVLAAGRVTVDGAVAAGDDLVLPGRTLAYARPPWDEPDPPERLSVLLLDDDLLALDKPAGIPVTPGAGIQDGSLLHLARERIDARAAPVHRIDRGTSGVVLFARNPAAARALAAAFREHRVEKRYLALVQGTGLPDAFEADRPIRGRPCLTSFEVLRRDADLGRTLVVAMPATGRAHQIRIHLASSGAPLVGEPLYEAGGAQRPGADRGACGFRLHAWRLRLPHPRTGSPVEVAATPPDDLLP